MLLKYSRHKVGFSDRHFCTSPKWCSVRPTPNGYLHDRLSFGALVNQAFQYYYLACYHLNCRNDSHHYHLCKDPNPNRNAVYWCDPVHFVSRSRWSFSDGNACRNNMIWMLLAICICFIKICYFVKVFFKGEVKISFG